MSKQKYTSREELLDDIMSYGGITKFLQHGHRPPYDLDTGQASDDYIFLVSMKMRKCWDDYLSYATLFVDTLDDSSYPAIPGED
jgi:hypothetical protein